MLPPAFGKDPILTVAAIVLAALALSALVLLAGVLFRIVGAVRYRDLGRQCPSCGGFDIRPSWRSGLMDVLLEMIACAPYRCRACSFRYYRFRRAAN